MDKYKISKTRDTLVKFCNRCKLTKDRNEKNFYRRTEAGRQTQWHSVCKECRAADQTIRITNPDVRDRRRKTMKKRMDERKKQNPEWAKKEATRRAISEARRRQGKDGRARHLIGGARQRAKKAGLPCTIDIFWVYDRLDSGVCEVTGIKFINGNKKNYPFTPSIDRIDPNLGYTPENSRLVLFCVNAAFGNWGEDMFYPVAEALIKRNVQY